MAAVNYTDEMIAEMVSIYNEQPTRNTVDNLAQRFEKTPRSIIAKLSAEGVYQKPAATTKTGEPVVRKSELVAQIQEAVGIEVPSAEKMTKADLQALVKAIG